MLLIPLKHNYVVLLNVSFELNFFAIHCVGTESAAPSAMNSKDYFETVADGNTTSVAFRTPLLHSSLFP